MRYTADEAIYNFDQCYRHENLVIIIQNIQPPTGTVAAVNSKVDQRVFIGNPLLLPIYH